MRSAGRLLVIAALAAAACSHPPRFVRVTPGLRLLYVPRTVPFLDSPKYSFELHRRWKGPKAVEGGHQFERPGTGGTLWVGYIPADSPAYKPPHAYRQWMTTQGTTEDGHVLSSVEVSSRTASRVRFTSYRYDTEYLLGTRATVSYTEITMVPDPDGLYVVRVDAPKTRFERLYIDIEDMFKTLVLAEPRKEE
jgi:hypothetical protein